MEFGQFGATAAVLELDDQLAVGESAALEIEWVRLTEPAPLESGWDDYVVQTPWPVAG